MTHKGVAHEREYERDVRARTKRARIAVNARARARAMVDPAVTARRKFALRLRISPDAPLRAIGKAARSHRCTGRSAPQ
eukprot:5201665-Pyramimonas_sp.AAC.1